ncbi:hypothetical protein Scep_029995 [Stephania cephalantha]|uniref:DNA-directed RNA polymerase subunit n=1 Tax=Stephania cephalantha TaxID=152367 RepID=A0AAP0DYQ5_9MAGN
MFFLSLIEHTLRLPPHLLGLPLDEAIKGELQHLFLDKVIPNLGLCVSVYDLRSVDGGFIFPGDGASTYTMSVGFFKDIYVPVHLFPNPSKLYESCAESTDLTAAFFRKNSEDGRWVWIYEGDELNIENEEEIRFRILSVKYPPIPVEPEKDAKPFAPMVITVSVLSLLCITYVDKFSSCSMF